MKMKFLDVCGIAGLLGVLGVTTQAARFISTNVGSPNVISWDRKSMDCASHCGGSEKCKGFSVDETRCQHHTEGEEIFGNTWKKEGKECPGGFVGGLFGLQCYLSVDGNYNYANAKNVCESKNAYLAELVDLAERAAVWNYVKSQGFVNAAAWVGIIQTHPNQDGVEYRDYKWERSGLEVPNTTDYWKQRYTSASKPPNCGNFHFGSPGDGFKDGVCTLLYGFICEW